MYDPFGWLSPFTLLLRQLLQRCMLGGRGWDSPLDPEVKKKFDDLARGIPLLADLSIPRWWDTEETAHAVDEQLHIFCDASAKGYGVVAYRRVAKNDAIHTTIVCAKSHVVPLNPARASHHNSIPRLELAAAEKAVEVGLFIERAARRKFPRVVFWSDSVPVLHQIFDMTTCFKKYLQTVCPRSMRVQSQNNGATWTQVATQLTTHRGEFMPTRRTNGRHFMRDLGSSG